MGSDFRAQRQQHKLQTFGAEAVRKSCGFFRTAWNRNLCSKCYRDLGVQEQRAASAKAAVDKTLLHGGAASASSPSLETLESNPFFFFFVFCNMR